MSEMDVVIIRRRKLLRNWRKIRHWSLARKSLADGQMTKQVNISCLANKKQNFRGEIVFKCVFDGWREKCLSLGESQDSLFFKVKRIRFIFV